MMPPFTDTFIYVSLGLHELTTSLFVQYDINALKISQDTYDNMEH